MASRKEQKEQARARRLAEEQAAVAHAARRRRMQMLGGVVLAAVVVIAVAIAISSGGSSGSSGPVTGAKATATEKLVDNELAGIPQSGTTLGNPKAPITMVYFGDLECPVCAAFTTGADDGGLPQLIDNQVKQGKVKVEYRSFCTATCNDESQSVFNTQQVAAYAAGLQDRFWNYAELFYHEQGAEGSGYVTPTFLDNLASQVPGLSISKWQTDRQDPDLLSQVESDEATAVKDGLTGTPTVIAEGPKGSDPAQEGIPPYSELVSMINTVQ